MRSLILIASIALAGCSNTTLYVGVHHKLPLPGIEFKGDNPAAVFRVQRRAKKWSCEYMHISQWLEGWPFNHDKEQSLDTLGCGYDFDL